MAIEVMNDLLTARQVQDLLQIDRTTVYRMLKDGRLSGVKIGKNWRFPRKNIDALLDEKNQLQKSTLIKANIFPVNCIQGLQNVFSEVAEVCCIAVDSDAQPLTKVSNATAFCQAVQSTPEGFNACRKSWQQIIKGKKGSHPFFTCHAGLNYAAARIKMGNRIESFILCGQFFESEEQQKKHRKIIEQRIDALNIDAREAVEKSGQITVLTPRVRSKLNSWLERLAQVLIDLTSERNILTERLKEIHKLSLISDESDKS